MDYRRKLEDLGITLMRSGKQTCPKCSATRRDKSDRCLSVTYEKDAVLYNCHHCGWQGAVYYNDTRKFQKVYQKPQPVKVSEKLDPLYDYFNKRKISREILDMYGVTRDEDGTIVFQYFKNGELVNVKHRKNLGDGKKMFWQTKDSEKTLYGMDFVENEDKLIWVEGECFKGSTEVLTPDGWVRLDEYNSQQVMQVDNRLIGNFIQPIAYVKKQYDGYLLEHKSRNGYLLATEKHNMVYYYGRSKILKKKPFADVSRGANIPTAIVYNPEGLDLTLSRISLLIAIQADGSLDRRKDGSIHVRMTLKKERKIERMQMLLDCCGIEYSKSIDSRGYTYFGFKENLAFKIFPKEWLHLSAMQRFTFLEELTYWDGNFVKGRTQTEYATKHYENAKFVQTMAHLSGINSTIMYRKNNFGEWYKVSILWGKDHITLNEKPKEVPYNGLVYCVQVPTGMILTRTEGRISVTGNCDVLSLAQQGIYAVSPPQGGSDNKFEWMETCFDFIDKFKEHIIAVDNDKVGNDLKNHLLERLGSDNCSIVNWGQYKDANEALMDGADLKEYIDNAQPMCPEGIETYCDNFEEIYKGIFEEDKEYFSSGWKNFDKLVKIRTGYLMVVTGYPSRGKSTFVDNLLVNLTKKYDFKHLIASFESTKQGSYVNYLQMIKEKDIVDLKNSQEEVFDQFEFISDHFLRLATDRQWTVDEIIERTEVAVKKYGIKTLVIDPYNRLKNEFKDREDKYIGSKLSELCMLSKRLNILIIFVAHPKKPDGEVMPSLYSIAGSGDWYNMADYGIIVHRERNQVTGKLENMPTIKIAKVKSEALGDPNGGEIKLRYNSNKKILEEGYWQ